VGFGVGAGAADASVLLPLLIVEPLLVELLLLASVLGALGELVLGAAVLPLDEVSVVLLLGLGLVLVLVLVLGAMLPELDVDGLLVWPAAVPVLGDALVPVPVCATAMPTAATRTADAAAIVKPLGNWLILKLLIPVDARPEADGWATCPRLH
jgi:hypothetical protein